MKNITLTFQDNSTEVVRVPNVYSMLMVKRQYVGSWRAEYGIVTKARITK